MKKQVTMVVDDVIWCLRDLARTTPKSIFDIPFLGMLKENHDKYGMKIQLHLFYRTDYFYGEDEFTLAEVPDTYKKEWEENSDWLKLSYHAKQEFPDYPHINATYEDMKKGFETVRNEIFRFAGEKTFTYAFIPHWVPVSREGCLALRDCGVSLLAATHGDIQEYNGDPNSLPYGHALRLLNHRQPETKIFTRGGRDVAISRSACAYNHLTSEQVMETMYNSKYVVSNIGLPLKVASPSICLNHTPLEEIEKDMLKHVQDEYFGGVTHEQYFYPDYLAYQPDTREKFDVFCKTVTDNGYTFIHFEDLVK